MADPEFSFFFTSQRGTMRYGVGGGIRDGLEKYTFSLTLVKATDLQFLGLSSQFSDELLRWDFLRAYSVYSFKQWESRAAIRLARRRGRETEINHCDPWNSLHQTLTVILIIIRPAYLSNWLLALRKWYTSSAVWKPCNFWPFNISFSSSTIGFPVLTKASETRRFRPP